MSEFCNSAIAEFPAENNTTGNFKVDKSASKTKESAEFLITVSIICKLGAQNFFIFFCRIILTTTITIVPTFTYLSVISICRCYRIFSLLSVCSSGVSVSVFDVGIGIRYFAIIYNFWCNTATAMSVGNFHVHVDLWITLQATPLISCEPRNAGATCQVLCHPGVNMSDNYYFR